MKRPRNSWPLAFVARRLPDLIDGWEAANAAATADGRDMDLCRASLDAEADVRQVLRYTLPAGFTHRGKRYTLCGVLVCRTPVPAPEPGPQPEEAAPCRP